MLVPMLGVLWLLVIWPEIVLFLPRLISPRIPEMKLVVVRVAARGWAGEHRIRA
jgi:hypothetical protein